MEKNIKYIFLKSCNIKQYIYTNNHYMLTEIYDILNNEITNIEDKTINDTYKHKNDLMTKLITADEYLYNIMSDKYDEIEKYKNINIINKKIIEIIVKYEQPNQTPTTPPPTNRNIDQLYNIVNNLKLTRKNL